jgi:hypothetical protein
VRVRFLYGFYEDRELTLAERDQYWSQVSPYLTGKGDEPMTDYEVGEFKDEAGESLLIIQKTC